MLHPLRPLQGSGPQTRRLWPVYQTTSFPVVASPTFLHIVSEIVHRPLQVQTRPLAIRATPQKEHLLLWLATANQNQCLFLAVSTQKPPNHIKGDWLEMEHQCFPFCSFGAKFGDFPREADWRGVHEQPKHVHGAECI